MRAKELVRGKTYLYTAMVFDMKVAYLHETVNGHLFESEGGVKRELKGKTVEHYIEELL